MPGHTFTTQPIASGGNLGAYRQEQHNATRNTSATELAGFNFLSMNTNANYNPSTQGEILSLNFGFDTRLFSGDLAGVALILQQNGRTYRHFDGSTLIGSSSWQSYTRTNLTFASFHEIINASTYAGAVNLLSRPDFSLSGSNIRFGYAVLNGFGGNRTATTGLDNWSVTLNTGPSPVPEPGTFALAGLALVSVAAIKMRKRR